MIAVVALNALLAVLYVWSWPGYTTVISVVGTDYHAVMDGREIIDGDVPGPACGGVALSIHGENSLPTGAGAPRVRSFQVTDTQTGGRVDLVLQNPNTVDLYVRYTEDGTNLHLAFRPWRDLDSGLVAEQNGLVVGTVPGYPMQVDSLQTVRGLLAVVLRLYPCLALCTRAVLF